MMVAHRGSIPEIALQKARDAYGDTIDQALTRGVARLREDSWRSGCLQKLQMGAADGALIVKTLDALESA